LRPGTFLRRPPMTIVGCVDVDDQSVAVGHGIEPAMLRGAVDPR
jgi:hypothetical protein